MTSFQAISQSFTVSYHYEVHFTEGVFDEENPIFLDLFKTITSDLPIRLLFVLDAGVAKYHPGLIDAIKKYSDRNSKHLACTKIITVAGGEESKNDPKQLEMVLHEINNLSICRHSFVVAIGGGAVIDMAGYAAATAHRGVRMIRIPTTVLAQNDAAVGVKNGINKYGKKNFLGAFATPFAIINDFRFLETLEQRDWISGIAEAIKVALIKDVDFFTFIKSNAKALVDRDATAMSYVIHRCAALHMDHIAQGGDPFESGSSRPLDFGHWAAHKLEQMTGYTMRHGEAVAKGMALDVTYAYYLGYIGIEVLETVLGVLSEIGFDLALPIVSLEQKKELMEGLEEFREHLGGALTITLISGIGVQYDVHEIDREKMSRAIAVRSGLKEELFC